MCSTPCHWLLHPCPRPPCPPLRLTCTMRCMLCIHMHTATATLEWKVLVFFSWSPGGAWGIRLWTERKTKTNCCCWWCAWEQCSMHIAHSEVSVNQCTCNSGKYGSSVNKGFWKFWLKLWPLMKPSKTYSLMWRKSLKLSGFQDIGHHSYNSGAK